MTAGKMWWHDIVHTPISRDQAIVTGESGRATQEQFSRVESELSAAVVEKDGLERPAIDKQSSLG
jgi:hypothetical protein